MAKLLVFLEHHEGALLKPSLSVLSHAAGLGGSVDGVVVGSGVRGFADAAGAYGAATVWAADDERLAAPLPQPRVDVLAKLVRDEGYDTMLFAQSVLELSPPPARGDSQKIEDDGSAAEKIVEFLAEKRLV